MGRGRAKAKQTKVARDLKYNTPETDFERLQRELSNSSGADDLTNGDPEPTDPDRPDDFTAPTTTDPGNPGDLTNGDPGDPGDGDDGGQGGDGGQGTDGGELPHTGASSGTMIALAAGLSGLGALVLFGTRRRATAA